MANLFHINSPFADAVRKLVQMIYVGLLWFLCSIPIVTMGAATTALYEVLLKMVKNKEGYIASAFFGAFRRNLKSATPVWILLLLGEVIFGVNLFYYAVLGGGQFPIQCAVFTILLLVVQIISCYVFPVLARFENTITGTFHMAALLAVRNLGWTIIIVFVQFLTIIICWFFLYFPVMFLMGITGYIQAVVFEHIFERLLIEGRVTERHEMGKRCED